MSDQHSCGHYIDSHAHLQDPAYDDNREEVLEKVRRELLSFAWVGYDIESSQKALQLRHPQEPVAVGVHPHNATGSLDVLKQYENMYQQASAVGEIGLDTVRSETALEDQLVWFRRQVEIALYFGKPIVIHEREAFPYVMEVLNKYGSMHVPVVLHCFSHGPNEALEALKKDFFISFAGNITYPKADPLRSALKMVPLDHLLLETDSPYLPPQVIRGKRNDPTYVKEVYKKAVEVTDMPMDELCQVICRNFAHVFGISLTFS
ncbi:MAG TPA: TatD family hydrolase [Coprothermobacter proteolyticus]|nr:TatD family hydrolase [Coprothermobacter proteolyticus]